MSTQAWNPFSCFIIHCVRAPYSLSGTGCPASGSCPSWALIPIPPWQLLTSPLSPMLQDLCNVKLFCVPGCLCLALGILCSRGMQVKMGFPFRRGPDASFGKSDGFSEFLETGNQARSKIIPRNGCVVCGWGWCFWKMGLLNPGKSLQLEFMEVIKQLLT